MPIDKINVTLNGIRILQPPMQIPNNNFGSLMISGNYSTIIGTSYVPNLNPVIIKDTVTNSGIVTVNWSESITSNTEFESRSMGFRFNEKDASLFNVIYIRLTRWTYQTIPRNLFIVI